MADARPDRPRRVELLLPAVEAIDALAEDQLPGALAHLAALQARLAARLTAVRPPAPVDPDDLLDVEETAQLTRRSTSWLHHHGHTLPGFRQSRGKGGRKFWSRRALLAWITAGDAAG
jgi:hypothetical protein